MHMRIFIPTFALLLAACGENQTAQAPEEPKAPATSETAQAPASAPTPPPTAGGSGSAPGTTGNVTPASSSAPGQTAAATGGAGLQPFLGRAYAAGPLSLQLNADNTFVMNEIDGSRKVEGRYAFQDGVLTFSEPKGDTGPAQFPMQCRVEGQGSEFRLTDTSGSCARFKDLTFKPAAG